ncbi:hypothetical protein NDA10_007232 [Ustilago hordei]|nr:hypothetical protein NDA10_007232 [Ustilago hordei]UTT90561.1 hypothetical protein NDA17_006059 [Ustilago hordei]
MFAPVVALVGLTGSGIVSGLALSYPLLINTHLIDQQGANISPPTPWVANLDTAQRLTLWERAYKAGLMTIPTFSLLVSACLTTFALTHGTNNTSSLAQHLGVNWELRKRMLLASAALTSSVLPFTVVAILPINKKLMALRKAANNKEPVNENEVDSLFKKWARLQNVRVTASVSSFVLALYSFIAV